jgi:hypothetical protein
MSENNLRGTIGMNDDDMLLDEPETPATPGVETLKRDTGLLADRRDSAFLSANLDNMLQDENEDE